MSPAPTVLVHSTADLVAHACAARLVTRIVNSQAARGTASVVLTGGGIGTQVLAALNSSPARDAIDWRRLDVYWGDERFVPASDDERNERQAREALLDQVDIDPSRVHPMDAADGPGGGDPEAAAQRYADLLASRSTPDDHGPVPRFDVLMLGLGPEGHTASIFPDSPAARDKGTVVAVHDCPKPPPTRISLTFRSLQTAEDVWMIASGESKAEAVARALGGADPVQVPAAGAVGRTRTLWMLDEAAASQLPSSLRPR